MELSLRFCCTTYYMLQIFVNDREIHFFFFNLDKFGHQEHYLGSTILSHVKRKINLHVSNFPLQNFTQMQNTKFGE